MSTRTAQGSIAWAISLNTVPYIAVPAYWIFGRSRFDGFQWRRHASALDESTTERKAIEFHWYTRGFMHQEVILVDELAASIGTANFDNRSMRLNFEVTMLTEDNAFSQDVKAMLETDFENSRLALAAEYSERAMPFRFAVRVCRLFAPIQ